MNDRKTVLILGATSSIARYVASSLAQRGYALYLASRNLDELERIAADIATRHGVPVKFGNFDADDFGSHPALVETVKREMGGLWGVVYAAGYMGAPQPDVGGRALDATKVITRNMTGAISILEVCAAHMQAQRNGFILGISSVAGDRGRKSNGIYGAAKAGLHVYLQGLRHRLAREGVRVVSIKPGLVDTPMTAGMKKGPLMASPANVGERIAKAVESGPTTVYVPSFWRYIMLIIRNVPEKIFHRTNL